MKPASYCDIRPDEIPSAALPGGGEVRVIAGHIEVEGATVEGPVRGITTEPLYMDVRLPAGGSFSQPVAPGHNAFVYAYEGSLAIGDEADVRRLPAQSAGVLGGDGPAVIRATDGAARFLLLAARPLREPVVQYGPFVMNTREEIEQAVADYRNNRLA
jgi:redox-sensitive bicupin YhaK (pirin superfamily)